MRRGLASIAIACAASGTAVAQPGQPHPAPGYYLLSDQERDLLARGEISDGAHVGGGLVGTFFGFGLGHLVQGRFVDKGWIFMAGEAAATTILMASIVQCYRYTLEERGDDSCDQEAALLWVGLIGLVGFRIWELADVWAGPPAHNARVRAVRLRAGLPAYGFFAAPSLGRGDGGGVAGLTLRF